MFSLNLQNFAWQVSNENGNNTNGFPKDPSTDSYIPMYESSYHPVAPGHSITARSLSTKFREELKYIFRFIFLIFNFKCSFFLIDTQYLMINRMAQITSKLWKENIHRIARRVQSYSKEYSKRKCHFSKT